MLDIFVQVVQEYERAVIFRLGRLRKEGSKVKYCCFDQFHRTVVCLEHKPSEPIDFSVLYFFTVCLPQCHMNTLQLLLLPVFL
jgi:hypothetical protein